MVTSHHSEPVVDAAQRHDIPYGKQLGQSYDSDPSNLIRLRPKSGFLKLQSRDHPKHPMLSTRKGDTDMVGLGILHDVISQTKENQRVTLPMTSATRRAAGAIDDTDEETKDDDEDDNDDDTATVTDSPRTALLARQLRDASEALEQLKSQVSSSRNRRLSRILGPISPMLSERSFVQSLRVAGNYARSPTEPSARRRHHAQPIFDCTSASASVEEQPGNRKDNDHRAQSPASASAQAQNPRISAVNSSSSSSSSAYHSPAHSSYWSASPKMTSQWMASPTLASSVDSTPRVLATPTLSNNTPWSVSSPLMSNKATAFSSSTTAHTSSATSDPSAGAGTTAAPPHTSSSASDVPLQSQASSVADATAQHSHTAADRHVVMASGIAGGIVAGLVLLLLLLWAFLFRRRRQRRRRELSGVLDKVAPPPPLPPRPARTDQDVWSSPVSSFNFSATTLDNNQSATPFLQSGASNETRPLSARDTAHHLQLPHNALETDFEANQRHSHELFQSGIIGGNNHVSRDLSFTWMFPTLSVPPAAARALKTGHYVKKRNTQPLEQRHASRPMPMGVDASERLTTLDAASMGTTTFNFGALTLMQTGLSSEPAIHLAASSSGNRSEHDSATAASEREGSALSAAASSSHVDPQVDHSQRSFVTTDNSLNRTRWWNSSLRGTGVLRSVSTPPSSLSHGWLPSSIASTSTAKPSAAQETLQPAKRTSYVLSAHDPVMQAVMERVLFMSQEEQEQYVVQPLVETSHGAEEEQLSIIDRDSALTSQSPSSDFSRLAITASSVDAHTDDTSATQESMRRTRVTSGHQSVMETCREDSKESVQSSRELRSSSGFHRPRVASYLQHARLEDDFDVRAAVEGEDWQTANDWQTNFDSDVNAESHRSARASDRVRSTGSVVLQSDRRTDDSDDSEHTVPAPNNKARIVSGAPRIMLTSTEEDGQRERPLSVTSVESTAASDSNDGESIDHSAFSSASESQDSLYPDAASALYADVATAIGRAFVDQMRDERRTSMEQTRTSLDKARLMRSSDSTIDSLVAYNRGTTATVVVESDDGHVAFDEAYNEAADALHEFTVLSNLHTTNSNSSHGSRRVKQRPDSYTPSETGTACLVDDDFPTIPSWTPLPNDSPWRSASHASFAHVQQH